MVRGPANGVLEKVLGVGGGMIKAIIFDLDGTLVQTETLKAESYAKAAVFLCPNSAEEREVIEDSATGVKSALAAGMNCVAVTTEFTSAAVHAGGLLNERLIVDVPRDLQSVVERFINESNEKTSLGKSAT